MFMLTHKALTTSLDIISCCPQQYLDEIFSQSHVQHCASEIEKLYNVAQHYLHSQQDTIHTLKPLQHAGSLVFRGGGLNKTLLLIQHQIFIGKRQVSNRCGSGGGGGGQQEAGDRECVIIVLGVTQVLDCLVSPVCVYNLT